MNWQTAWVVFGSVFLAEMGDKTQLATFLFASDKDTSNSVVFVFAAAALVAATAIGVLGVALVARYVDERVLNIAAGIGFIAIGAWTLFKA